MHALLTPYYLLLTTCQLTAHLEPVHALFRDEDDATREHEQAEQCGESLLAQRDLRWGGARGVVLGV